MGSQAGLAELVGMQSCSQDGQLMQHYCHQARCAQMGQDTPPGSNGQLRNGSGHLMQSQTLD